MDRFIKKTLITFIVFALGLVFFVVFVHLLVKISASFDLNNGTKYIVLGHSHPECAFNDDVIEGTQNLAKSGESYFYTFQKVKEILSQNKVEVIFIEYTNNVINKEMDDWIWGYNKMNKYVPWHSPFMSFDDLAFLNEKNESDFPLVITTSTRNNLTRLVSFDLNIGRRYGAYNRLDRNVMDELLDSNKMKDKRIEISKYNIEYLKRIVLFGKEKGCEIYFVRSPQHQNYDRYNESKLIEVKEDMFPEIEFLDFDNFPLSNEEYADRGHINFKGAKKFSSWFNQLLNEDLLLKKDKPSFIKIKMKQFKNLETRPD